MIRKVKVEIVLLIDDDRVKDIEDINRWGFCLIADRRKRLIHDWDLDRPGEISYQPKVTVT
jgi:hypothetical protein